MRAFCHFVLWVCVCLPGICAIECAMAIGGRSFRRSIRPQLANFHLMKTAADESTPPSAGAARPAPKRSKRKRKKRKARR